MGLGRVLLFIGLTLYLILANVVSYEMQDTYSQSNVGANNKEFIKDDCFINVIGIGFICFAPNSEDSTSFTMATTFGSPYVWLNLVAIGLPFIIWVLVGISFFLPTTNAGQ